MYVAAQVIDQLDQTLAEYGEGWVLQTEVTVESDGMDAITTAQAAELVHVPAHEIRRWATVDDPRTPGTQAVATLSP
ncbi:hypothetical protein AB0M47_04150 [Hamadaea sp. NPDC051192]|uniref:hypothetical protein n=1 Tax=Hamadaea sp. NPDC051192 TaxID=3154940 RepID=UPI003446EB56